mgnify:CR=1 FL=1
MIILAIAILVLFFGGVIYGMTVDELFYEQVVTLLAWIGLFISLTLIAWALDYTLNYFNLIK